MRQLRKQCDIQYPNDVTDNDVIYWRRNVVDITIKPVTWNSYIRHLRAVFKFGIENNLLTQEKNPFDDKAIITGKGRRKTISINNLALIENYLQQEDTPPILKPAWFITVLVATFRYSAIRRSQLIKLKIEDIDLSKRVICIMPNINKNHEYHEIPISHKLYPHITRLLTELKRMNQSQTMQLFNLNLFCSAVKNKGKLMTKNQLDHLFKVLSNEIGFLVSPHRFRHTAATNLMKDPNNLYVTKELLGHKDIKVTLSYIEYDVEMIRDRIDVL
ncbi:tyrosine-type recombinase/integrase [Phocoenobacter skyensis]|uniref:tyrosine-type recombinase/integrase n=1 Tax=Phocoenobacter skyensis TaxID=97481 RepID=UPI0027772CCC|nr:site-specific integrase [Pasteurella skyensis]MDP8185358.1 site-specific integrase [Pasteurella skyensis]